MADLAKILGAEIVDNTTFDVMVEILNVAIKRMNERILPRYFTLFHDDVIPTNQRNLTDVRTRMGILLEYELAQCIKDVLPRDVQEKVALTYVIANRFPDFEFRRRDGGFGLRFEVKAIQTIAEEKSANFDTLIKDIRRGTDFVVVLVWEWQDHKSDPLRHPNIDGVFVFDAYQLAQMRDCYWLNTPPSDVGAGCQGYDLCYGVNCTNGKFNKEEGNYGKLTRIFSDEYAEYLPSDVAACRAVKEYTPFVRLVNNLGLERILRAVANEFTGDARLVSKLESPEFPLVLLAKHPKELILFVGDVAMPNKGKLSQLMAATKVTSAMRMNSKFSWVVQDRSGASKAEGRKPHEAKEWVRGQKNRLA